MSIRKLEPKKIETIFASKLEYVIHFPLHGRQIIETACRDAENNGMYSIVVNPSYASLATKILGKESRTRICALIGFPFGLQTIATKVFEIVDMSRHGYVDEVDVALNLAYIVNHRWRKVEEEMSLITHVMQDVQINMAKVFIETGQLSPAEIGVLCSIANDTGIKAVKTTSGFLGAEEDVKAIKFMKKFLNPEIQIIASGFIKDKKIAVQLLGEGVNRIATNDPFKFI